MAGMTKQDVANAVWRTDDITAGSTEPNKANTKWIAETYLKGTFENTVHLLAQSRANGAALSALDSKVGTTAALSDAQVQAIVTGLATDPRFATAIAAAFVDTLADRMQS